MPTGPVAECKPDKKVVFINYLIWNPEHPNFSYKYELFSKWCSGAMFHLAGGYGRIKAGNFDFLSRPWSGNVVLRQAAYALFCIRRAVRIRPDYIISYDPLICGLIGVIIKLITGGKLVIEVNTDHFWKMEEASGLKERVRDSAKLLFMRACFRSADGVKFINGTLARRYTRTFGLDGGKARAATFFSFISTHVFRKNASHGNYILCVGHPYHVKGVDVLIRAFNIISPGYPGLKLKVIGHCEDRTEYERLANGNPDILFFDGMEYTRVIEEFENCRIAAVSSRTEAMSRVILEAMACGKPVIGSNVGGIPDIIRDGHNGLLFESEDHEMLAGKLKRLLDDEVLARRLGEEGFRTAQRFSPDTYAETYRGFLAGIK